MAEGRFAALSKLGSRERAMFIVLGLVVVVALVYLVFLKPGGGTKPHEIAPPANFSVRPTASATPTETSAPGTFQVFEGKDPFRPLVGAQAGGNPSANPTASPGPTGGASGHRVHLLDIFKEGDTLFATVEVDGTEYKVKEGDTFDGNFRVVSLTSRCGTFVFGDERFTLCIGQEVFK